MYEAKAIAKLMEAIRGAASMGRWPCSHTPRSARRAPRGTTEGGGEKVARGAREARSRGQLFPPVAFRGPPRRAPRAVPEHGRLPMDVAPRISSINFAIALTLLIKGNRGPLIISTVMADVLIF